MSIARIFLATSILALYAATGCSRTPEERRSRGTPRDLAAETESDQAAALTSIFFAGFCASAFFGSVTVSTPFLKLASILSVSTPSGMRK